MDHTNDVLKAGSDMSQLSKLEKFFSVLKTKRESLIEFMTLYEAPLAPRFNVFDFIWPDELSYTK